MNQPQVRTPPQQQPTQRREEPELDPEEIFSAAVETVKARLSMAKSISLDVFGAAVDNETVVSVYDRLNDQIAELLGGDEEPEE